MAVESGGTYWLLYFVDILNKFGARVRDLRKEKGWSQERMAQLCRFDRTYIGRVERGERNPALKNIEKIAKVFDVPISELMKGL
ncbi:MAG: helix-turn-helix transcriptional regulator [Cyclobacteriaceae bacterium]